MENCNENYVLDFIRFGPIETVFPMDKLIMNAVCGEKYEIMCYVILRKKKQRFFYLLFNLTHSHNKKK